jgi:hypothetical protein
MKPEQKVEEKRQARMLESADALAMDDVDKTLGTLRSETNRLLSELAGKLDGALGRYRTLCDAIAAKQSELDEVFEISKAAGGLAALLDAQRAKREEFEGEMARRKAALSEEMEAARAAWEHEETQHETALKERETQELKTRKREREEYEYAFTREKELAQQAFADEKARLERELQTLRATTEAQLGEREKALLVAEKELAELRGRAAAYPSELDSAVAKAVKDAAARAAQEAALRATLQQKEFEGERNVMAARIQALEQQLAVQMTQIEKLSAQTDMAYRQMEKIAVNAVACAAQGKAGSGQTSDERGGKER